jgi:hypothetical protein
VHQHHLQRVHHHPAGRDGEPLGAPTAYPAIYLGCHYSNCSPGFSPRQISSFSAANSSISLTYPNSGTWDAAYDIWLNADTNVSGVQDTEIMIWLNHTGSVQPVGGQSGSANVGGRNWTVWTGNNGQNNVVSYVSPSAIAATRSTSGTSSWTPSAGAPVRELVLVPHQHPGRLRAVDRWRGPDRELVLRVGRWRHADDRTADDPPADDPSANDRTAHDGRRRAVGTCSATYNQTGMWQGGFQAEVTVRNNGSSTLNGWTVRLGLAGGQSIQNLWNGVNSGTSGTISVRNQSYNGSIGANGTTTFGYVANGSPSTPSLSCTSP